MTDVGQGFILSCSCVCSLFFFWFFRFSDLSGNLRVGLFILDTVFISRVVVTDFYDVHMTYHIIWYQWSKQEIDKERLGEVAASFIAYLCESVLSPPFPP